MIDDHTAAHWPESETFFVTQDPNKVRAFRSALLEILGRRDDPARDTATPQLKAIADGRWGSP